MDPLRHLNRSGNRLQEDKEDGVRLVNINYGKFLSICESHMQEATDVVFVPEDPANLFRIPDGRRNTYFIPYLLIGEAIENEARDRLIFLSSETGGMEDEFKRQEFFNDFQEKLEVQKAMLLQRTFYTEIALKPPQYNFDKRAFPFAWSGYLTNQDVSYRIRAFQFVWEQNLKQFALQFNYAFSDPADARLWKKKGNYLKLGVVFNVLLYLPRHWTNGMPSTVCMLKGFRVLDGRSGELVDEPVGKIQVLRREVAVTKNTDEIIARLKGFSDQKWK